MNNFYEALSKNTITRNINKELFENILNSIIKNIIENRKLIQKSNSIDLKYYDFNISIDILKSIIQESKNKSVYEDKKEKSIVVLNEGNPYVTLLLCIDAIRTNNKIIILLDDKCLALNTIIVNIVKQTLEDYRIKNTIHMCNLVANNMVLENIDDIDKIICIKNKNDYLYFKENNVENVDFYGYENVEIYCDCEELIEIEKIILEYGYQKDINIDICECESVEESIEYINTCGSGYCSVILTKSDENGELFKKSVNSQNVYVNESPFKYEKFNLPEEYLLK